MAQIETLMGLAYFTTAALGFLNLVLGTPEMIGWMVAGSGVCTIVLHTYVFFSDDPDA